MIIEMRTYRMKPGSIPEVEKRFAEGLKERTKVSPLGAFFHTEVGPLNRIIHCWPYDDLAHRTKVRSQSIPGWPPKIQEFIEEMESKIIIPAPFSPKLEPRRLGGLYEIRTYTMLAGRHSDRDREMGRADRGPHEAVAAGVLRPYRDRRAQPVDPCLGLQGCRRALSRSATRRAPPAPGRPTPAAVRQAGEHVRRAGRVLAAALEHESTPLPPGGGEGFLPTAFQIAAVPFANRSQSWNSCKLYPLRNDGTGRFL